MSEDMEQVLRYIAGLRTYSEYNAQGTTKQALAKILDEAILLSRNVLADGSVEAPSLVSSKFRVTGDMVLAAASATRQGAYRTSEELKAIIRAVAPLILEDAAEIAAKRTHREVSDLVKEIYAFGARVSNLARADGNDIADAIRALAPQEDSK